MNIEDIKKTMWNIAGKAGLVLGFISAAYMFLTILLEKIEISAFIISLITFVLWGTKFAGCIWVMKAAMKAFAATNDSISNRETFKMGILTSLLSAFVFAVISYANVAFISVEMYTEQMDVLMQQMAPMMDSNTMDMMDKYLENLPEITFISNLIYCFLYGTVVSAILSRNIPSRDPFADYKPQDQ